MSQGSVAAEQRDNVGGSRLRPPRWQIRGFFDAHYLDV
jgi:hypothetical protein